MSGAIIRGNQGDWGSNHLMNGADVEIILELLRRASLPAALLRLLWPLRLVGVVLEVL